MKRLEIIRNGQPKPKILKNGDKYDSILNVYEDDKLIHKVEYVNTDPSNRYQGAGILKEGSYGGICFTHHRLGKSILLFKLDFFEDVKSIYDIRKEYLVLPSKVKNVNQNGRYIMSEIFIHRGGLEWDWSKGCITILKSEYDNFIKLFKESEKVLINLSVVEV